VEQITRVGAQREAQREARGQAVRVGVDLAKRVIQVHGVDGAGRVLVSRALARVKFLAWCAQLPAGCIVAMESSSSAHHWARKLIALGLDARIIAAQLVSPYHQPHPRAAGRVRTGVRAKPGGAWNCAQRCH